MLQVMQASHNVRLRRRRARSIDVISDPVHESHLETLTASRRLDF
jgi:hypothetical protein